MQEGLIVADCQPSFNALLNSEPLTMTTQKTDGDWKWWITTGLLVIGLVAGSVWKIADEFSKIEKHLNKVETAVRIIGAKQSGDTPAIIDEVFKVAKNAEHSGQFESAKKLVDYANRLMAEQEAKKAPAPQEFFDKSLDHYQALKQNPELRDVAHQGTLTLAEYRTAIIKRPPEFNSVACDKNGTFATIKGGVGEIGPLIYIKDAYLCGERAFAGQFGTGAIDGFYLENVTFENMTITYHGGPVVLRNVHFINCRFSVPNLPNGDQLLTSAIKQPASATIG